MINIVIVLKVLLSTSLRKSKVRFTRNKLTFKQGHDLSYLLPRLS